MVRACHGCATGTRVRWWRAGPASPCVSSAARDVKNAKAAPDPSPRGRYAPGRRGVGRVPLRRGARSQSPPPPPPTHTHLPRRPSFGRCAIGCRRRSHFRVWAEDVRQGHATSLKRAGSSRGSLRLTSVAVALLGSSLLMPRGPPPPASPSSGLPYVTSGGARCPASARRRRSCRRVR